MAWYHRIRNLIREERLSRELDREIAFHVAETTDALVAACMSPSEAEYEARRRFGNPTLQKERTRDTDILGWLESLAVDARYATRALRANPAFALVAILSIGLGIGANTAIFSLIDATILRALPVPHAEQLVQLRMAHDGFDEFTNPIWEQVRDRADVFDGIFAVAPQQFDRANGGEARPIAGNWVSGSFFSTLGVRPAAGRLLERRDDVRGCPAVAVLGYGLWQRDYGATASAVGRTITLDGHPFEIIGVAEPSFFGVDVGRAIQVYAPLCAEPLLKGAQSALDVRLNWFLMVFGRPRAELGLERVNAALAAMSPSIFAATLDPELTGGERRTFLANRLIVTPAAQGVSAVRVRYRDALLVLMVVVGAVLLIACLNVANLLLARAAARQREMAIRLAIGAGRWRLVRQLLTESLVLAAAGTVVGLLIAIWSARLLVRFISTPSNAVSLDLALDGRVLAFSIGLATITGLLFGLVPAWRATRIDPQTAMKAQSRGIVGRTGRRVTLTRALVVAQVALSLVLVAAAGLLLGTFRRLDAVDPGFMRERMLLVTADFSRAHPSPAERLALTDQLLARFRTVPGVEAASASLVTPISGRGMNGIVVANGFQPADRRDAIVFFNLVSDGYFATMGTALVAGRALEPGDRAGAPRVAVINETMARRYFGAASPLGREFHERLGDRDEPSFLIVGVVRDAKYRSLREDAPATAFIPLAQDPEPSMRPNFEIRTGAASATSVIPAVTAITREIRRDISLQFTTMSTQVSASLARERLLATLSSVFGGLALLLAIVGLYGTVSHSVTRRRTEIGVRIALGAARRRVVRMVLGEVAAMLVVGLVVGAALARSAHTLIAALLFEVSASDLPTWTIAVAMLAIVALAAGALPAWRASRLDPMLALRDD